MMRSVIHSASFLRPSQVRGNKVSLAAKAQSKCGYASYAAFHQEVEKMVSDSFAFHDADTKGWINSCMLQKDLHDVRDELLLHGCGQLLEMPEVPRAMEAAEVAVAANALDEPK